MKKSVTLLLSLSMIFALTACGGQSGGNDTANAEPNSESAETVTETSAEEPTEPYTDEDLDYNVDSSRVVYEHENSDARTVELVESTVPDWESYDTVFIGYPNMEQGFESVLCA